MNKDGTNGKHVNIEIVQVNKIAFTRSRKLCVRYGMREKEEEGEEEK